MTPEEYEALPYRSKWPFPFVTATVFAFYPFKGLLTGVRKHDAETFPGCTCIPGGFLEAKWKGDFGPPARPGETIERTAIRELREETGLDIGIWRLRLFHVHSDPETDPRGHVVNICYVVMLDDNDLPDLRAGDDLESIAWMDPGQLRHSQKQWAFNHQQLSLRALEWVAEHAEL